MLLQLLVASAARLNIDLPYTVPWQVVDFPDSIENGNFCVKPHVDEELDMLKKRQHGLPDLLNVVAEEEKERLPREVGSCTVCYIPHIGHLVAMPIKQAVVEQGFDYKNIPGYQFVFENNGSMLYRNECTESLDDKLGDVVLDITRIEMRIQAQLTEQVLDARICLDKAIRWVSSFCASPVEKKYYHCI